MTWTRDLKVQYLVRLPWTVEVSRDTEGGYLAEVAELPFLLASGRREKDAARHLYEGLWTALDAILEHEDALPLPAGATLPWEHGVEPVTPERHYLVDGVLAGEAWTPTASAVTRSVTLGA